MTENTATFVAIGASLFLLVYLVNRNLAKIEKVPSAGLAIGVRG